MNDLEKLANLIFPDAKSLEYYEGKYPKRKLDEGAIVTRFAPSPTGFTHIGGIYQCIIVNLITKRSKGVAFLRIEDTDQEREIENGIVNIIKDLKLFNINFDEGNINEEEYKGNYGPYKQSERKDIYQAFAKHLIKEGKAYPCFLSKEELDEIRERQMKSKNRPGIYGIFAKYRDMPIDMAYKKIEKGDPYIIRFKSPGRENNKIKIKDIVKGNLEMTENTQDVVIIKSDGLPTYHFAHLVDDYLMGTTHVIRSDEWLSSLALHIQLFISFGFKPPKYAHYAPIEKMDGTTRRKISKRKDPEASAMYYIEEGFPIEGIYDYLLNVANSNYENWRKNNPRASSLDFNFELSKMSKSGALFDMEKLLDVSKIAISYFTADKLYNDAILWAEKYDEELLEILSKNKEYSLKVLNIERGKEKNPRKDIAKMSDVKKEIIYMYDEKFDALMNKKDNYKFLSIDDNSDIKEILEEYLKIYDEKDSKEEWWSKISNLSEKLNYAKSVKEFKENPNKFKGHVGDVSTVIRVALTGRSETPDLYEIMNVLGSDSINFRIKKIINLV